MSEYTESVAYKYPYRVWKSENAHRLNEDGNYVFSTGKIDGHVEVVDDFTDEELAILEKEPYPHYGPFYEAWLAWRMTASTGGYDPERGWALPYLPNPEWIERGRHYLKLWTDRVERGGFDSKPTTPKQRDFLIKLGAQTIPEDFEEASRLIDELKRDRDSARLSWSRESGSWKR